MIGDHSPVNLHLLLRLLSYFPFLHRKESDLLCVWTFFSFVYLFVDSSQSIATSPLLSTALTQLIQYEIRLERMNWTFLLYVQRTYNIFNFNWRVLEHSRACVIPFCVYFCRALFLLWFDCKRHLTHTHTHSTHMFEPLENCCRIFVYAIYKMPTHHITKHTLP